ncbi:Uncharacterized conserved protein YecT, DUF1311 family [Chitinophaga eiseniae]|uniref:Uncharacterized conserved protein YecT, DUF1311 family n=1 Tax=Chitinophaga eiseniae TaxID=634771 RepID=A0A1T4RHT4_9BACT|nr:lysozyme inhibitor LprI family protein [Chitinophaga eiseniae]SKA15564.1 Uncharacterized conserved protein YecT, DUF1311 family [Chitinophaga eiseniae]
MKSLLITLLFVAGSLTGMAQTQSEMNKQAGQEYKEADKKLNTIYQEILKKYAANKTFITNFREAQRLWVQLRDAQLKAMYPGSAKNYGSMFPMCKANYLTELTNQRTEAIRVWLNGLPPGETCTGSVGATE